MPKAFDDGHFFVLSGFIMAHVYLLAAVEKRFSYRRFLINRVARIYPLHLAVLLAFGIAVWASPHLGVEINQAFPVKDVPANLFLVHAWGVLDHLSWNTPSWSISAEWFAYLTFPAVAALLAKVRAGQIGLLIVLGVAFFAATPELNVVHRTFNFAMIRIMPEFILGGLMYIAGTRYNAPPRMVVWGIALSSLALIGLAHWNAPNWMMVLVGAGLVYALAERSKSQPYVARPLQHLGEISYSIYMTHVLVILCLAKIVGTGPIMSLIAVIAILICAAAAYRLVEVPGRAFIRHLATPEAGNPGRRPHL